MNLKLLTATNRLVMTQAISASNKHHRDGEDIS
jgi:hypothetical protein